MVAVWIVLAAFGLALFIGCGALVEMYRSLEQVREHAGASDAPTKIEIEFAPDVLEQAGLTPELARPERALLMILSDRCSTCETIAGALNGGIPDDVRVLLHPYSAESADTWLSRHNLAGSPAVTIDHGGRIADVIGIHLTPTVLRIAGGRVVTAHTVPSTRRLFQELEWLADGGPDEPRYQAPGESYYAVMNQLNGAAALNGERTKGATG